MPFRNNNEAAGISPTSPFQVGRSNADDDTVVEDGVLIPWASSPTGSYLYYDCTVAVVLDSGLVVHTTLPQVDRTVDVLSASPIDAAGMDKITDQGVNLKCNDQYHDVVQRMAHSRYWFHMWGQAIRVGYRIPIPGIKTVGGVPAIPHDQNPQWAFNRIMPGGNFGGLILWHAEWSLWYTVAVPPTSQVIPEVNLGAHISGATRPPDDIQSPYTRADGDAENIQLQGFFQG